MARGLGGHDLGCLDARKGGICQFDTSYGIRFRISGETFMVLRCWQVRDV
jgi:hypothetical protein